jgi:dihydroorotate dehydrogenase
MYKLLFSIFFRCVPAEIAHHLGFGLIRAVAAIPGLGWLLRGWLVPRDPVLRVRALGFDFPGPLGLAAGFDKDALGVDALGVFGFAFIEIGTVTAQPQPGNPTPRLFRLVEDRALVNRMGFNNAGSAAAAARLRARGRGRGVVVGVNIGKSKVVPENEAVADYVASARLLADVAEYLVVNVSSPNTPGLRNLQAIEHLRPLLVGVRDALDEATGSANPRRQQDR